MYRIEKYIPNKEDIDKISTKFDIYSKKICVPEYDAKSFAFKIYSNDNNVIGDLFLKILHGVCEIKQLYVDENFRKQGIAKDLIAEAEKVSIESGAREIILWTLSWQGEGFYEKCGFTQAARIPLNIEGTYFDGVKQFNILYRKEL